MAPFTILVNSFDGFEDCWVPFFTLFARYWPECPAPILLNTGKREWDFPPLKIVCARVELAEATSLTWSRALLAALGLVQTPLVLYLQEDYFIDSPVYSSLVDDFANVMLEDPNVGHIGLTHFGSSPPFEPSTDPRLWRIAPRSHYRISTQAGLWRVETLKSYLRPEENAWMFEIFGTRRAWRRRDIFLTANRDLFNPRAQPIIHYTHTGIIKGRWHPAIPSLFQAHGIHVDFSKRGLFHRKPRILERLETLQKVAADPFLFLKGMLGK